MAKVMEVTRVDISKFRLKIFTMGGNGVGESYLILFMDESKVVYSILIDSLVTTIDGKDVILPMKFIEHYEIKKLDCIIWTHPHDDHSMGLDTIIGKYYGKQTKGFLPKFVYGNQNDVISITDVCQRVRKKMTSQFRKNQLIAIDCAENEPRFLIRNVFEDRFTQVQKEMTVCFLTPIGYPFDQKIANDAKYSQSMLNSLSLSLVLNFDGYCFYFGGDCPGAKIKQSCTSEIAKSKWTTIPHHGSSSSKQLRKILNKEIHCATCTTFLSQPLPEDEVLKLYKIPETIHLDVTQKTKEDEFTYGVIEYDYDFATMPNAKLTIHRYGNAYKY